jgi:hypothetical protein
MIKAIHPVKGKGNFSQRTWELLPVDKDGSRSGWVKAPAEQPAEVSNKLVQKANEAGKNKQDPKNKELKKAKASANTTTANNAVQTNLPPNEQGESGDGGAI